VQGCKSSIPEVRTYLGKQRLRHAFQAARLPTFFALWLHLADVGQSSYMFPRESQCWQMR
jgi:hypothetical protein